MIPWIFQIFHAIISPIFFLTFTVVVYSLDRRLATCLSENVKIFTAKTFAFTQICTEIRTAGTTTCKNNAVMQFFHGPRLEVKIFFLIFLSNAPLYCLDLPFPNECRDPDYKSYSHPLLCRFMTSASLQIANSYYAMLSQFRTNVSKEHFLSNFSGCLETFVSIVSWYVEMKMIFTNLKWFSILVYYEYFSFYYCFETL